MDSLSVNGMGKCLEGVSAVGLWDLVAVLRR